MSRFRVVVARRAMGSVQSQPRAARTPVSRPTMHDMPLAQRALAGVTSQPLARGVFRGGVFRGGLGDDAAAPPVAVPMATDSDVLATLDQRTQSIVTMLDEQNKNRKLALIIAGASAVFAAVKLGFIVVPHVRSRVAGQ